MRKLKPTKRPKKPPHSAIKDPAGYASFSLLMITFGLVNIIFTTVVWFGGACQVPGGCHVMQGRDGRRGGIIICMCKEELYLMVRSDSGWIIEQIDCWTLETFDCARLTARGKAVEQAVCPACRQPTPIEIPDKVSNLKVAPASEQHLSPSSGQLTYGNPPSCQLVGLPAGQADPLQL